VELIAQLLGLADAELLVEQIAADVRGLVGVGDRFGVGRGGQLAQGVLYACPLPGEELTCVLGVHGGKYGRWRGWLPTAVRSSER
jgi:hypothetical protein